MAINDLSKANTRLSSSEFKPLILDDEEDIQTQDIDTRVKDQDFVPQYIDVDKPKFVQPEQRSYYVAGNVANNEIHTTAQRPNEIEYEADVVDDEKKKDNYFGLSKLKTNKVDIVKNALKYVASRVNPIKAVADDIGKLTGKSGEDVALEGIRGFAGSTVDFASAMTRFFGQNYMYFKGMKDKLIDEAANIGSVLTGGEDFSDDIKQKYTDFYNRIDRQTQEFKDKTERFLQYTGIGKTDKDGFIYDLVGGGASLMYAIGITAITKSPAAAAEFFGMYQYQGLYEEGIEKGFSPIKARTIGVIGGAAEGVLEMVGLHMLIETLVARKSFMKLLKAAATEFVQEASQQGAEEFIAKLSGMREEGLLTILQNVGYAGLIGALIGGGSATVSNVFYKQISDSATRELINKGVNSDYAKQMVNSMLDYSVSPQVLNEMINILKDEQSPVTYKNADPRETYKETGEAIKKALDPQQKRGVELELIQANKKLTQELANVLLNSGKAKNGDDAYRRAEQVTAMYDMLAREAYNQEGIRPEDYYKRFHVNTQSGNIEIDERNVDEDNPFVDVSFDPVDFDPEARAEYEAAMDAEQDYMDQIEKENKTTLKKEARILGDMGIDAIRRPTPDGVGKDRWGEYKDLSNRIKNYFFSDDPTAMSWDDAEKLLAESSSDIKDLFAYLAAVDDRAVTLNQPGVFNRVLAKEKERIKQQAIADGTFLKAPNGKDSNLPEQLWLTVRTKAFKNWFGDWLNDPQNASKVVDENGEPLVVYHGTDEIFNIFDKTKGRANMDIQGSFFSPYKIDAQGYGKNIYPVFLNIKNPASENIGYKTLNKYQGQNGAGIKARKDLIKQGYDGVNNENAEYIVFDSKQVKSINNRGSFDKNNPDIYYQQRNGLSKEEVEQQLENFEAQIANIQENRDNSKKAITIKRYIDELEDLESKLSLQEILDLTKAESESQKEYWIELNKEREVKAKEIKNKIKKTEDTLVDRFGKELISKVKEGIKKRKEISKLYFDIEKEVGKSKAFARFKTTEQYKSLFGKMSKDEVDDILWDDESFLEFYFNNQNDYIDIANGFGNILDNIGIRNKIVETSKNGSAYIYFYQNGQEKKIRIANHSDPYSQYRKPDFNIEEADDYNLITEQLEDILYSEIINKADLKKSQEKFYQDEIENSNVVDLSQSFEELKGLTQEQAAQKIEEVINSLIDKPLQTGTKPLQIQITSNNKQHITNTNVKLSKGQELRHRAVLANLKEIIKNAVKIDKDGTVDLKHNTRQSTIKHKKNIEKYIYFLGNAKAQTKDGIANFDIELSTEQVKGQDPNLLDLYHVRVKKQSSVPRHLDTLLPNSTNDRLTQNNENVNSNNPRGAITVMDRQYYIDLFSGSDKSTLLHEGSHGFLSEVLYFAKGKNPSPKILAIKKQLDNWLGEPEDNGRYSKRQQELFAGASETYFMEGKAPTPKLKTVFERFKKWLTDIYDAIRNDLPKINDDVRELFDTILSRSYNVPDSNIYAGKEAAIKEVIKNIQEGRASEVDGITIDDVYNLLNVAYTRKPSKPSKNLKQLLNDKNIYDFNELNKAGADTVLQILKDGGYVKEDATAEAAVELAKAALDGKPIYRLADQWRVAGDIDFARNLRVLEKVIEFSQIDSVMEKILTLQQEGYRNVEQSDVDKVQDEYKRLMSADVKEAKKIVEDIINRLHKKRFIDRAAQKQMIVDLNFSSTVEEIKESVLNVIEDLQDEIKLVKEQLRNPRKPIVRKDKTIPPGKNATEEEKNNYKKYMRRQINKLLKQALPRKQNQQKFSKFDVETQRFFTDLENYNKMTIEAAQEELYKRATSIIDDEGVGLDNFEKMKNMFLSYKANKINQNSVEFYKQLYDNLQEINVFGRNAKDIENTLKKEQIQQDINSLVVNIEDNKSKNKGAAFAKKWYVLGLGNWWSTINAIAGKKQADKDSLERIEIDIFNKKCEITNELRQKCAAALGVRVTTDLDMTVNKYLKEEYTYEELDPSSNTRNAVKLNKMQLICCYIWMKNSTLRDRIVRAYGNEQIIDMMDKLTIQDKKMGDELQKTIAGLYDDINAVYLKMYGLDMPQAENYFPSAPERIQGNMDLLKDNIGQASSPGFIKARVQSNLPLMNFGNPFQIALNHIAKVSHFIYMQLKIADLNKVYKATKVKRDITNAYGINMYKYITQMLDNVKFTNVAKTVDLMSSIGDYLTNNYVLTKVAVKPSIMIKQLLSCINYAEDMSSVKWFGGFLKGLAHPKKTIDFMMKNSKYCQNRFAKGGQTEALLKAVEGINKTFAFVRTFKEFLSLRTRIGDIGAIIFGGYPLVMDQMSKGVPLKTAIENFERATIRSQQASLPSTLSNWQYRGMNNWFTRAMFAFANTPSQYSRKIGDTIYSYFHGDIDKKQLGKNLLIYGVFNSLLYTSFTSLAILTGLVSGDWDDLKDDIITSLFQCSNMLAIPLIGQGYNNAVQKYLLDNKTQKKEVPLLYELTDFIDRTKKEDMEFNDFLSAIDDVASVVFGIPVKTLYTRFVSSTKDLLDGEYGKFAVKYYGATESRANKIFD